MSSRRSSPTSTSLFDAALAAALIATVLFVGTPARAADSLPAPANATSAASEDNRTPYGATPGCPAACEERPRRLDDAYVFAATRSLRQSGIQPVIAVAMAPATLLVDAVLFPFALALDHLRD